MICSVNFPIWFMTFGYIATFGKKVMEECIIKKTSSLGTIIIKEVPKKVAKELIVANHYSHKWLDSSFGKFNYGIFREEEPDRCLGVAAYGYMKNSKARILHTQIPRLGCVS